MTTRMIFARRVFRIAGIYGLAVLLPQYFLEERLGRDFPPATNHPEHFYGFLGVAVAWQLAFLIIASDPKKYRLMMIPGIVEKASFAAATFVLYWQHRLAASLLAFGVIDLAWALLFAAAFQVAKGLEL
ncbi:MAG: hypothetical protein DCC67_14235 [Planctomycetota bacterium]|nr:MAG: hypothetical protein DCC67_14235 [Planctomycetota bacterium]